jgi:hypothetical protein
MAERQVTINVSREFRNRLNELKGDKTYEEYLRYFLGDRL